MTSARATSSTPRSLCPSARLRRPLVTHEDQLVLQAEPEAVDRHLESLEEAGPKSDLPAGGAGQDPRIVHRRARIVRMEADAEVQEQLEIAQPEGLARERPHFREGGEHEVRLGKPELVVAISVRLARESAPDVVVEVLEAEPAHEASPGKRQQLGLHVGADRELLHVVVVRESGRPTPGLGAEPHPRVVVAPLRSGSAGARGCRGRGSARTRSALLCRGGRPSGRYRLPVQGRSTHR